MDSFSEADDLLPIHLTEQRREHVLSLVEATKNVEQRWRQSEAILLYPQVAKREDKTLENLEERVYKYVDTIKKENVFIKDVESFKDLGKQSRHDFDEASEGILTDDISIIEDESEETFRDRIVNEYICLPELSFIEARAAIAVIDLIIDQLRIIKHQLPAADQEWEQKYQTIHQRYGKEIDRNIITLLKHGPGLDPSVKLQSDRGFLEVVLNNTINTLKKENHYFPLYEAVRTCQIMRDNDEELVTRTERCLEHVETMREKVDEYCTEVQYAVDARTEMIAHIRNLLHDEQVMVDTQWRYVDKWEKTRLEQNRMELQKREGQMCTRLTEVSRLVDVDVRCDTEIKMHYTLATQQLEESLEFWKIKYDEDMETIGNHILATRNKRETLREKLEILRIEVERQEEEIRQWKQQKAEKREQVRILARQNEAARVIQRWWRHVARALRRARRNAPTLAGRTRKKKKKGKRK